MATGRAGHLKRALWLEYLTVAWNSIEAVIALGAAAVSGSVALLGFGIDSIVESASAGVLVWRLRAEQATTDQERIERIENRTRRLVALSLVLLALYVAYESITALVQREQPRPTWIGIALALASIATMWWLWRAKQRAARDLDSRAFAADAFQTEACFWLSLILLAGVGLNALLGWWWADPLAALAMTVPILSEAKEAWEGEEGDEDEEDKDEDGDAKEGEGRRSG